MLRHLYVDNYKCLVNFEFTPGPLSLLLGRNGCGKSAVFEALARLRDFGAGTVDAETAFRGHTVTRWSSRDVQTFALRVDGRPGTYDYRLEVEHRSHAVRVGHESLKLDERPLLQFERGDVHLFHDDGTAGPVYPANTARSAVASVPPRPDHAQITAFQRWLDRLWIVAPDPRRMSTTALREARRPSRDLDNLAEWYRHVALENGSAVNRALSDLRKILDGFGALNLKSAGADARVLQGIFEIEGDTPRASLEYDFSELSDGQRMLIALYLLLHVGLREGATLCIDEPDNFVALAEIQPWLVALRDTVEERSDAQILLISHNREVINYLARDTGVLFERHNGGPVRVRPFEYDETLLPAETIARGWE